MGIRLYFRNKDKPKEEFCLGKYFSYAEKKDCCYMCVKYLLKHIQSAYDLLVEYRESYEGDDDISDFLDLCSMGRTYDYGEFFEMGTDDLCGFISCYIKDKIRLWQYDINGIKPNYLLDLLQFIGDNGSIESVWEFQLI